jgi:plasmid stabilization system protein ParE
MPNFKVAFASSAEADLYRIADYLFENDFDLEIVDKIRQKITQTLSRHTMSGSIYDETLGVRKALVLRKNVVYYLVKGESAIVLHIRAGRMNKVPASPDE